MTGERTMINWQWCRLQDMSTDQLYAVFAAREAVFVVEQNCAYQELDGLDAEAAHLVAWSGSEVAAYLRVLGPGSRFEQPSIGRVMTAKAFRGRGLGRECIERALKHIDEVYSGEVRISAQSYLEQFYRSFGFEPASQLYMEDGIPHIEMVRKAGTLK
jgi:ElaA protein